MVPLAWKTHGREQKGDGVKQVQPEVANLQRYRKELEETWQNSLNQQGPENRDSDRRLEVNRSTVSFLAGAKGEVFSTILNFRGDPLGLCWCSKGQDTISKFKMVAEPETGD